MKLLKPIRVDVYCAKSSVIVYSHDIRFDISEKDIISFNKIYSKSNIDENIQNYIEGYYSFDTQLIESYTNVAFIMKTGKILHIKNEEELI